MRGPLQGVIGNAFALGDRLSFLQHIDVGPEPWLWSPSRAISAERGQASD